MDTAALKDFIVKWLGDGPEFLVGLTVSPQNEIVVEIDSDQSVDIDRCAELTRAIEAEFPREKEDYELEVGSAGLTSPLRLPRQFAKHRGHDLQVDTRDGRRLKGLLVDSDQEGITLEWTRKVKVEGKKKPVMEANRETIPYADVKSAVWDLKF